MSNKIPIPMEGLGVMDTDSNDLSLQPGVARLLQNCGDLYAEGKIKLLPGYAKASKGAVMANCTDGTVAVVNGSYTVTGTSTNWMTDATHSERVMPGDIFLGPDGVYYTIQSVESDTVMTLESPYEGATDSSSAVNPLSEWVLSSAAIIHRVWLLKQFYVEAGEAESTQTVDLSSGTTSNTEYNETAGGLTLTPDTKVITSTVRGKFGVTIYVSSGNSDARSEISSTIKFQVTAQETINSMWMSATLISGIAAGEDIQVTIETDSSGSPSGTPVTNATATFLSTDVDADGDTVNITFAGAVTLSAATNYWLVMSTMADWDLLDSYTLAAQKMAVNDSLGGGTFKDFKWKVVGDVTGTEYLSSPVYCPWFAFLEYPQSGENTWISDTINIGYVPDSNAVLSMTRNYINGLLWPSEGNDFNSQDTSDALVFDLEYSDDGSAWTYADSAVAGTADGTVSNAQYAWANIPLTIDNSAQFGSAYHQYWRITLYMTSDSGESTPLVTSITLEVDKPPQQTGSMFGESGRSYMLCGSGDTLFKDIRPASTNTLSTAMENRGFADAVQYKGYIFITNGTRPMKYWDGIGSLTNVDSLPRLDDGSAGANPPVRSDRITLHNDKMMCYKNLVVSYVNDTSTGLTATVLTDSAKSWTNDVYIGYRLYPNTDGAGAAPGRPGKFFLITDNDGTTATCAAGGLTSYATVGDTYLIGKDYLKWIRYSEEEEPGDWPTGNVLPFGDKDGDDVQAAISWKRRLIVVCKNSIWRVLGFGPADPWEKGLVCTGTGTLSPYSIVDTGDILFWWSPEGIVAYQGGYNKPKSISGTLKDIVRDGINTNALHHVTGHYFDGLCFWSYPTSDSNINNRTMIYNPETGRVCIRNFGMYTPATIITDTGQKKMYFFEPTSGLIQEYGVGYSFDGASQQMELKTSHIMGGSPHTDSSWRYLLAVIDTDFTKDSTTNVGTTVELEVATDYGTTYTAAGEFQPWNDNVTGYGGVSSSATAYIIRLEETLGATVSVKLKANLKTRFEIRHLELVTDPVNVRMYEEL